MKAACFLLPSLVCGQDLFLQKTAVRPNLIWVMADDMGWGEVGLYPSTSKHGRIATPYLDKFGAEGIQFMHAYAGYTVCAPSRTTFFTGRHSGSFQKYGLSGTEIWSSQSQTVTTVASMLRDAGYATGAFGKVAPLDFPHEQGFDAFFGQIDQAECHNMYPKHLDQGSAASKHNRKNVNLTLNWKEKDRDLCMANPEQYNYTIDAFHDAAMAWLETTALEHKPFFLYMSYTVPHAGGWTDWEAEQGNPVPSNLHYNDVSWPDVERDHAAVITYMDAKFGDMMQRLTALGVDENTLVIFASDNGAHVEGGHSKTFFNSTGGLQGNKRSLYEGGYRSPTMARWPAKIQPRVSTFPWAFWDVMPTFAELSGGKMPSDLDGISIVSELTGEGEQAAHEYLYWTWNGGYSIRIGDWKGVVTSCADETNKQPSLEDEMKLYNVVTDPFEEHERGSEGSEFNEKIHQFKSLLVSKDLSCKCYQCMR